MRVTDKMIFERANRVTARARELTEKATGEAASGERVVHPGDDPAAASLVVGHRQNEKRFASIGQNAQRAYDEMGSADGALDGVTTLIHRAQVLAVQFSNESYSASDRANGAAEISGLSQQLVGLLNTRHANRYVFAGLRDNVPAFLPNGTWNGSAGVRQVEVAPGQLENASVSGDEFVQGVGVPGGVDLFAVLNDLATALSGNNTAGITTGLSQLEQGHRQVVNARTRLGTGMNLFEVSVNLSRETQDSEQFAASRLVEVDIFEAASRLAQAQRGLEAAMQASAKSFELTLLNRLR